MESACCEVCSNAHLQCHSQYSVSAGTVWTGIYGNPSNACTEEPYYVADRFNCLFRHCKGTGADYTATKQFDELAKSISDISSKTTADDWEKMAKTAADIADKGSLTADEVIDVSNGRGNVTGVKTGLYLVYAKPANSARFGYTFVPYLISAPNNEFAMTGSGSDSWIYDDIDIELKPEQTGLMGSLQINKTLKTYNTALGEPVFAFDVEAYDRDGNVVFSDIASIRFDSTGAKSVVIDNIPAGSRVIVKEVYAAGSYQVTSSDSIETQIVAGETADVDFTNDYNDKLIYSTGVVNHFEYDGTGWEWVQN